MDVSQPTEPVMMAQRWGMRRYSGEGRSAVGGRDRDRAGAPRVMAEAYPRYWFYGVFAAHDSGPAGSVPLPFRFSRFNEPPTASLTGADQDKGSGREAVARLVQVDRRVAPANALGDAASGVAPIP